MAGYSGTPLVQKLGIKAGHRVVAWKAPEGFEALVGPLPAGASYSQASKDIDVLVAFHKSRAILEKELPALMRRIKNDGMIWIAWPKKASGVATDLHENLVRDTALPLGLVDIKVCAIDETWSGLKLVIRKENRAARAKA